jgi:SNF2 family DNA or RNA helicase
VRPESDLREPQKFIRDRILNSDYALIVSAMGSGKSAASLSAIRHLLRTKKSCRILIIAPKFVARNTWPDEIKAWEHLQDLEYAVCSGTEEERIAAINQDCEIMIINKDNLQWLAKHLGTVEKWIWDTIIIDEMSMFKAGENKTKRARVKKKVGEGWVVFDAETGIILSEDTFKNKTEAKQWARNEEFFWNFLGAVLYSQKYREVREVAVRKGGNMTRFGVLTTARKKVKRIYGLTGTPAPNGEQDLWGQIYLLDQGERLGRTKKEFEDRFLMVNAYTHERKLRPGAKEEIQARVKDIMVSLPPLDLVPPPVFIPLRVQLPAKVMKEYREFERTLFSQPYDVEAVSKGVLTNKLLQFCNGAAYRADGTVAQIHTEKLDALDEIIEREPGENLLIFYGFKFDLDQIRKRHPDAVVLNEEPDAIRLWNEGKIKKLLAHPASCAHGLNLQYGGHVCVWFGLTFSLELFLQANARLPRPGQKHIVAIYQIIAEGTYDEIALDILHRKDVTQQEIIESVLHRFDRVSNKSGL